MNWLNKLVCSVLDIKPEPPRLHRDDLQLIAELVSKQPLVFEEKDIERIAHKIVDHPRDVDLLALKIVKSRPFYKGAFWVCIALVVGYFGTVRYIAGKVETDASNVQKEVDSKYRQITNAINQTLNSKETTNIVGSILISMVTKQLLTYTNDPNLENLVPGITNLPAQAYAEGGGTLYQWDVKSQSWR